MGDRTTPPAPTAAAKIPPAAAARMFALPTTQRTEIPKTDLSRQGTFTKERTVVGNIPSHWKIEIGVDEIT
jgi:hypothetical protein